MFFKKNPSGSPVVKVKKASDIINAGSHRQKKYLSLMLVPSYTTGKTRTLRIPRSVFYVILIVLFAVSALIAGLQIRGTHMQRLAEGYSIRLNLTLEEFDQHVFASVQEMEEWIAANKEISDQLDAETIARATDRITMERDHQGTLDYVQGQLDELYRTIQEFEEALSGAIEGLSARADIVPAIYDIMNKLHTSQAEIRNSFYMPETYTNGMHRNFYHDAFVDADHDIDQCTMELYLYDSMVPLGIGGVFSPPIITKDDLLMQIAYSMNQMEMLQALIVNFVAHREQIEPHCLNHPTLWPVRAAISSGFGNRRCPFGTGRWEFHSGVDIGAPSRTPIHAAGGGTVIFAGWSVGGLGNLVIICHGNGYETWYAHNRANLVTKGQRVERGEIIAEVGMTGRATGTHLHFEVHRNGVAIDPRDFLIE